jgi:5'-methylthioinosine phosphorylase
MSFHTEIAIIGGSGLYQLNPHTAPEDINYLDIPTPFADQACRLSQETLNNKSVYFLPRHGVEHSVPPHKINYRSHIWALKELSIKRILAVNAVGGIAPELTPGSLLIPDQLIDYTWGREHSFFDGLNSLHDHIDFTFPYDDELRNILIEEAANLNMSIIGQGCFACTQGPRLETAAEVQKLKHDGCDVVGMTGMPEAALARELGMAYACITLVVNPAAGLSEELITIERIKSVLETGLQDVRKLLTASLARL